MKKLNSNQLTPNFNISRSFKSLRAWGFLFSRKNLDFSRDFGTKNYQLFNSARTALAQICRIVNPAKKIGIPAVCCAVMATPFLAQGKEIEWLDTDESGLLDLADFAKKADKIDLLIAPHTFGQELNMAKIAEIAKSREIFVVEDCAHFFKPISEYADAQIISFGREKDLSCISGGALIWHDKSKYAKKFLEISLPIASKIWTIEHLLQPLILSLARKFWFQGGRYFAGFWSKIGVLPRAVSSYEKCGREDFPQKKMPRAMQEVLRESLNNYQIDFIHRQKLARKWEEFLKKKFPETEIIIPRNFFRVVLTGVDRKNLKEKFKKSGFDLNEWDGDPISPAGVNLANFFYQRGDCLRAEDFMISYITLPTNIWIKDKDIYNLEEIV